jgi:hypothetical protein
MTGETILYSGHEEDCTPHTQGVALMLGIEAQKALRGWKPRGPRHLTASLKTKKKNIKMNVVLCYVFTNDSYEEDKDGFYDQLNTILEQLSNKDINILMGDFNAKIGNYNSGYEGVMGQRGVGDMNKNGERFADACADLGEHFPTQKNS